MPAIRLDRVSRVYGKDVRAVSRLTLEIPDGSFTTLLGPSGCGKTTTLRMIAGLEMPTEGTIHIGDAVAFSLEQGRSLAPSKRGLGLVFQSYALWPHLTVAKNITFGLEVQRVGKAETARRLEEVATALQIDGLLERYTSELSGGQQQRVAIARVLVMRPSVLLLDEPLSNLDATLRMDMRAELKRLHLETGSTVIYVTHDQLEALTMSTHIALMSKGELQQFAPPLELYAHPANRFAADFLGNPRINLLEGHVRGGRVVASGLEVPLPAGTAAREGDAVTLGLRAEEVRLHDAPAAGRAPARVDAVLPTGADWYYRVLVDGQALTVRQNEAPHLSLGDAVHLEAAPDPLKLFAADGAALTPPSASHPGVA
jgi:ABC-type sugar transport system ATPase subunit